ncbi:hypothetical protein CQ018_12290 [Arthrobacter sp. MYb227]|nr:hypothetical protein CQ018_12290 [Arthrobacter sp. MYb227]
MGLAACTTAPEPLPSASSLSTSTEQTPAETASTTSASETPSDSPAPTASAPTSATSPTTPGVGGHGTAANGGTMKIAVEGSALPATARCEGFAQNLGTVESGGGGLSGATIKLGTIPVASTSEILMLPGSYNVRARCSSGELQWEGTSKSVLVKREQDTDIMISLRPLN